MVIGNSYGSWEEIVAGFPQGSILGSFLLDIFVNDLFLSPKTCNIANYVNDNVTEDCFEVFEKFSAT